MTFGYGTVYLMLQSELLHSSYTRLGDTSHMNTPQLTFQHEYGQYCNVPFLYEQLQVSNECY